jgi:hypothetical protein
MNNATGTVLLLCTLLLSPCPLAQPRIYVSPAGVSSPAVGTSFAVDVRLAEYENVRGFSIEVLYNQAALRHTSVAGGNMFSLGGGPGSVFLSSGSRPDQGYILADAARIGGGGSSGADARLFTIHFQAIGPGSTNIYFDQVLLRDADNQPLDFTLAGGIAAVASPLPTVATTIMPTSEGAEPDYSWMGETGMERRVVGSGSAPRGKLTAARYQVPPAGGEDAPFLDPDGSVTAPGIPPVYWEVTSSLGEGAEVGFGFSFAGLSGPPDAGGWRLASRGLAADADDQWMLVSAQDVTIDAGSQSLRYHVAGADAGSGQYALVYDRAVEIGPAPPSHRVALETPYPNPARGAVSIHFEIADSGPVELSVHDLLGRRVALLVSGMIPAGAHSTVWYARHVAPGTYVVRLHARPGGVETRLLTIL